MSLFPLANRQELLGPPVRPRPSVALRPIHFVTAPADGFMKEIQEESGGGAAVGGGAKCSSLAFSNMPLPLSFLSPRVLTSGKLLTPIFHPLDPRLGSAQLLGCSPGEMATHGSAVQQCPSSFKFPPSALISETISRMTMCRARKRVGERGCRRPLSWHYGGTT